MYAIIGSLTLPGRGHYASLMLVSVDTRQPGTVFKKLDTRQSEILTNFLEMARLSPLTRS